MSIFEKFRDLLRMDINAALENAQDPEKKIKLFIEDAKSNYSAMMTACAEAMAVEKTLQDQVDHEAAEIERYKKYSIKAVEAGNDSLAEKAIDLQTKAEDRLKGLTDPLANAKAQTEKMKADLEELKEKIDDTERNASVLIARAKGAKALEKSAEAFSKVSGNSPLNQMDEVEKKIKAQEIHAESLNELSRTHKETIDDQFKILDAGMSTKDRLAKLKESMNKTA